MLANGETVTLIPRVDSTEDAHGNVTPMWGAERQVDGCAVYPKGASTEPFQDGRDPVAESITVLAPPGTSVLPHDRARVRGELYEVEGFPFAWQSPLTGWAPGVQFDLTRVEG